jgi:hypothetical protein
MIQSSDLGFWVQSSLFVDVVMIVNRRQIWVVAKDTVFEKCVIADWVKQIF